MQNILNGGKQRTFEIDKDDVTTDSAFAMMCSNFMTHIFNMININNGSGILEL